MFTLRLPRAYFALLMATVILLPAHAASASAPSMAERHGERGRILLDAGKLPEAYKEIAQAYKLDPSELQYQYWLVEALTGLKRYAELEATYRKILRSEPDSADIRSSYAHFLVTQKRYREAVAHYEEAFKGVSDPEAHVHCGDALMALGRSREAVDEYLQAARLDPKAVDFALGAALSGRRA